MLNEKSKKKQRTLCVRINKILDENDDSRFINKGSTYVSICADFDNIRSYILTNIYIKFK
jgi:hypothetical protein